MSILKNKLVLIGGTILLTVSIVAIFANIIAPYTYWRQNFSVSLEPPSLQHPFGTDPYGRDVFSRVIHGARASMISALAASGLAGVIGIVLGLLAGYLGGWLDRLIQGLIDITWSIPTIVLGVALIVVMKPGELTVVLAIIIGWWSQYARVIRGDVLSLREETFVEASRALGSSRLEIMWRNILPNVLPSTIVLLTTTTGRAIALEAALSFLGIGIQPPTPSWGVMLSTGRQYITIAPWLTIYPGVVLSLTILGFSLVGDGMRDILDPYLINE